MKELNFCKGFLLTFVPYEHTIPQCVLCSCRGFASLPFQFCFCELTFFSIFFLRCFRNRNTEKDLCVGNNLRRIIITINWGNLRSIYYMYRMESYYMYRMEMSPKNVADGDVTKCRGWRCCCHQIIFNIMSRMEMSSNNSHTTVIQQLLYLICQAACSCDEAH